MKRTIIVIALWGLVWLSVFFSGCDEEYNPNTIIQLTFDNEITATFPVWHPNRDLIVFSGCSLPQCVYGLWTIDTNGGNLKLLLGSAEIGPEYLRLIPYDYSDDGYLLFSDEESIFAGNVYYLPPDGGEPTFIFQGGSPTIKGNLDGIYNIAYYYKPQHKGPNGIYLTDIHGSEPQLVIADDFIYGPHWSPDGNNLTYYKRFDSDGYWLQKLCVYDFTTQKEEVLLITDSWGSHSPRWSPDGEWIAFTDYYVQPGYEYEYGQSEVYIIPSEGGEPKRLSLFPYDPHMFVSGAGSLFWSPDGNWIVYDIMYTELWKVSVE